MSLFSFLKSIFAKKPASAEPVCSGRRAGKDGEKPTGDHRRARRGETSQRGSRRDSLHEKERRDRRDPKRTTRDAPRPPAPPKEFPPAVVPASNWDPAVSYIVEEKEGSKRFTDFDIPPAILHGLSDLGFKYCTPIQAASLEQTMAGRNVAGRAQTGTGKTAAFLIAIFKRMLADPSSRPTVTGRPAALVLAPTRELVIQIAEDAKKIGAHCGLRCLAVYGGCDHAAQQDAIEAQPLDLIAATPGRLLDFRRAHVLDLTEVKTLVIDEADRMLDMGFIPDVRKIVYYLPRERQTLLFSATLGEDVMRLASQWMPDPVEVAVDDEYHPADTIAQIVYPISTHEKFAVLYNLLRKHEGERILVFRNRKSGCEDLVRLLNAHGIAALELSGDVDQKKRIRILEDFRAGRAKVVVATDVAARGLQVDDISLVVNYDFPYEPDDYIHRIGRTGRAGETGTAVSFACEDESFIIPDIEKLVGRELPCEMPEEALFAEPPAPVAAIENRRKSRPGGGSAPHYGARRGGPRRRSFGGGRR